MSETDHGWWQHFESHLRPRLGCHHCQSLAARIAKSRLPLALPVEREYEPDMDEDLGLSRTTLRWEQEREEHFDRYGVRN